MSEEKTIKQRVMEIFQKNNVNLSVEEPKEEVAEVELMEAELEDGQVVYTDAEGWAEGVNVYVKNDDGEKINVPVGEYPLKDGGVLIVEEDGIVKEIRTEEVKEETTEEVVEEEMTEVKAESQLTKEDVLNIIEKTVGALRTEFKSLIDAKDKEIEKLKTEFKHKGLPRAKEVKPEVKVDLSKLKTKERVKAIFEQTN
jgi:hypothetical protein